MECLACDLTSGRHDLPGGRIFATEHWVVEHCIGTLGVGTLIVKPFRHVLHLGELTPDEAREMGPLIRRASAVVQKLNESDQVYACLWSHMGWKPGHIHVVIQPAWARQKSVSEYPGPFLQVAMFREAEPLDEGEVAAFCERARTAFQG